MNPNPEFIKAMGDLRDVSAGRFGFYGKAMNFQITLIAEFNGGQLKDVDLKALEAGLTDIKSAIAEIEKKLEVAKAWKLRP